MNEERPRLRKKIAIHWIKSDQVYQPLYTADEFLFKHFSLGTDTIPHISLHAFKAVAALHGFAVDVTGI